MAWLELHQSLPTHRKTLMMADALDVKPVQIVGHLTCLWLWALDNAQDGVLHVSPQMIARAAQWEDEARPFTEALLAAGFLEPDGHIHDWDAYAGRLIEGRRKSAERAKAWREQHGTRNVPSISNAENAHGTRTVRVANEATVPNRTVPNRTVPSTEEYSVGSCRPDADTPAASQTNDPAIGSVLDARSEEPPPEETPRPGPLAVPKPTEHPFRDLWTAFDQIFGEARTRTERGRRAKACEETRESRYTAAEIVLAAQHWPNVMGDATMTELGIVANLGKLLHGPQVNGRSNGTVTAHTQRLTETALVPHQATVADIRRRRKGNDEPGR
jgi:hypothetical protein